MAQAFVSDMRAFGVAVLKLLSVNPQDSPGTLSRFPLIEYLRARHAIRGEIFEICFKLSPPAPDIFFSAEEVSALPSPRIHPPWLPCEF